MSKRKVEEGDIKDEGQPKEKKAKTESKDATYYVVKIENVDVDYEAHGCGDCSVETYLLGQEGTKRDKYGIRKTVGTGTLFWSYSRAMIAAIEFHLDGVSPKQMRKLGISPEWEEGSFESLQETLKKLNDDLESNDDTKPDGVGWCRLEVIECKTQSSTSDD